MALFWRKGAKYIHTASDPHRSLRMPAISNSEPPHVRITQTKKEHVCNTKHHW